MTIAAGTRVAAMPSGPGERYDFFLSRRGSVAAIAQEVTDVLTEKGYRVFVQDYDIHFGDSLIEKMHEAVSNSRDLVILFTHDYLQSPYTRKELTSFEAQRLRSQEERHIVVLRCDDAPLVGLLSDNVYQNLVGIADAEERKRRIIAAAERQSQAEAPPPRPFVGVPPRIPVFTGRAEELERLDTILMTDKAVAVTQAVGRAAVQGLGGVGKTTLAIEYAYRFRGLYAGVWWCPAETRTGLLSSLADLAVSLGAATTDEAEEKAAKAALRRLAEQRATWFLVYDNVSSPDEIADLLPSSGARVLITSRFSDWGEVADEVALDVLPPEEAIRFLQNRTGRSDASGARVLAEALGYLPLALDHAAAYCKRTQMRFLDYAAKASSLITTVPRGAVYPRSVAATFDLAISQAVSQCGAAEELMAFLAQCAPVRIPMLLVEGAIDDQGERLQALVALAEVSLVRHDAFDDATEAVMVHRLVQAVARTTRSYSRVASTAAERIKKRLAELYPKSLALDVIGDFEIGEMGEMGVRLKPHLLARPPSEILTILLQSASTHKDMTRALHHVNRLAFELMGNGDIAGALSLYEGGLAHVEKLFTEKEEDRWLKHMWLNNLAIALEHVGKLGEAILLHERALANDPDAEGASGNFTRTRLARLLLVSGQPLEALAASEIALAFNEKTVGSDHTWTTDSARVTADALDALGRTEEAKALRERYEVTEPEKPKSS
jgi:tetratricopeptide (TPR) repeat protein